MLLVIAVGTLQVVVESDNVERVGDAFLVVAIDGRGYHARRIELMALLHHRRANLRALLRHLVLQLPLFVADRPEMIDGELRYRLTMVSSCARPSGLELICRVSHIIIMPMRSQPSTHSGVGMLCDVRTALQPISFNTPSRKDLQPIGQGRAHACMILMIAGALNLDRFAVEEESLVRIEHRRAHAKADALCIAWLAAGFHSHNRRIEIGRIRRPKRRIGQFCGRGEWMPIHRRRSIAQALQPWQQFCPPRQESAS